MVAVALPLLGQPHAPVHPRHGGGEVEILIAGPASQPGLKLDRGSQSTIGQGEATAWRRFVLRWKGRCETAACSPSGDGILAPQSSR